MDLFFVVKHGDNQNVLVDIGEHGKVADIKEIIAGVVEVSLTFLILCLLFSGPSQ
jgi:hypothetical protein